MGSGTRQFPLAAEADDACAPQAYKLSFAPAHLAPAAAQASARPKQLLRTAGGHRRTGSGCAESGRLSCGKCGRSVPSSMLHMSREEVAHEVEVEKKFLLTGLCTHNVVHVETHAQYPHFASIPYSVRTTTPPPPPTHTHTLVCAGGAEDRVAKSLAYIGEQRIVDRSVADRGESARVREYESARVRECVQTQSPERERARERESERGEGGGVGGGRERKRSGDALGEGIRGRLTAWVFADA